MGSASGGAENVASELMRYGVPGSADGDGCARGGDEGGGGIQRGRNSE